MDHPDGLQALLDHTQDKVMVVTADGTCSYVNEAVRRILGYVPEDVVGRDVFAFIHPDDVDEVRSTFWSIVEEPDDRVADCEYRFRAADVDWVWLSSRMSNHRVAEVGGYVVSSRDVSDRKASERHRLELQERLSELAANTDDVLWSFSADWSELLFVNDAYEDIWGMSTESLRENPQEFLEGVHPDDRPDVARAMERLSNGESVELEYRVNPGSGYRRWVWVRGQPVITDGEVTRVVGFVRDVTDRLRRERQLWVMDRLLRHNLRNDMNVVLGHADAARERGDEEVQTHMDVILQTGRDLLLTAEKERDIVEVLARARSTEPVELVRIVESSVAKLREEYPNTSVETDLPSTARVSGIAALELAVGELLENAAVHGDPDPEIRVSVTAENDRAVLCVENRGTPIPDDELDVLEGKRSIDSVYHGTGLGLWLVHWIVDLSDGTISVDSLDGFNRVTVRLDSVE